MIRWSYVLPRLGVLIVLLLVVQFTVPVLLKWTMIQAVEMTTGMAVEVDRTWASVLRGRVQVDDVQIASSPASERNALKGTMTSNGNERIK